MVEKLGQQDAMRKTKSLNKRTGDFGWFSFRDHKDLVKIYLMAKLRPIRFFAFATCIFAQVLFLQPSLAVACPTCKDGLHNDGTALAYAVSILFMMAMPFLITVFWAVTIFRLRAKAAELQEAQLDPNSI